jgi:hypothetical protein
MSAPLIRESVHISDIRAGDLVEISGIVKTVGRNNLKSDGFMGLSLFGDTYRLGTAPVTRCRYERVVPTPPALRSSGSAEVGPATVSKGQADE